MFWAPNGLTELPKMHFKFPFNLTGNLTVALSTGQSWHVLKSRYTRGTQNKDFGAVSQTELTRNLVPSVAPAGVRKQNENY